MFSNNYLSRKLALCFTSLLLLSLPTIAHAQRARTRARSNFQAAAEATFNDKTYGGSDIVKLTKLLNGNPALVRQRNERGETLLHLAARGSTDILELLIARKSDVNARDGREFTPLYDAVSSNQPENVTILLANKADPNVKSYKGNNLVHAAASWPTAEPLKFILTYKFDVNARNDDGETPLIYAAGRSYRHNDESIELLIANQADVTLKNNKGQTALHRAAEKCGADAIKMLLAKNLDANAKDDDGNTPLLLLADSSGSGSTYTQEDALKPLLDAKADVNAQNKLGETALFRACKQESSRDFAKLLLANKANPNLKTNNGQLPACPSSGGDSNQPTP